MKSARLGLYKVSDLLDPQQHVLDLLNGANELEPAKYSIEEIPELIGSSIHFREDGSMLEAHEKIYVQRLQHQPNSAEIMLELERQAKLRTERYHQRKEKQLAESKAECEAELNDPEYQESMWRNDLELQLWDENNDLGGEQRSVYERQLSGLR